MIEGLDIGLKCLSGLPVVLSAEEVLRLFASAERMNTRVAMMVTYAGGLRISETLRLKVGDIASMRMVICVRNGKGGKDRIVPLSKELLCHLRKYFQTHILTDHIFAGRFGTKP